MKVFEILMLVCFGCSWPVAIHRSWTSRSTGGKSPVFLALIIAGYIAGVINKLINNPDYVTYLYALNAVMVSVDLCLYVRNRRIERGAAKAGGAVPS